MWRGQWPRQATGCQYRSHFGTEIERAVQKLYKYLLKPEAAILVQIRTGKIGLGGYLKRIKAVDTAICQCQQANKTVSHVLGECQEWSA